MGTGTARPQDVNVSGVGRSQSPNHLWHGEPEPSLGPAAKSGCFLFSGPIALAGYPEKSHGPQGDSAQGDTDHDAYQQISPANASLFSEHIPDQACVRLGLRRLRCRNRMGKRLFRLFMMIARDGEEALP